MRQDIIGSKYVQLKSILTEQIKNGILVPGAKIPTHRELMSKYNLSCSTVSRALLDLVYEGFIYREPGKGTFVASPDIVTEKEIKKNGNFAFIICKRFKGGFLNPFISEILEGMETETSISGYKLFLKTAAEHLKNQAEFIDSLVMEDNLHGVIFAGNVDESLIQALHGKYPFVWIHNCPKTVKVSCVVVDALNGAYEAVRYLIGLGHEDIGFISGPPGNLQAQEEFDGYRLGLKDNGLTLKRDYVVEGDFEVDSGYHTMQILLKRRNYPSAVFAANDAMAIGAMKAIDKRGMKIPEDISIVGFNDIEWSKHTNPPLTTVGVNKKEIGLLAIRKLVDLIKGEKKYPLRTVVPTELVIRQSCKRI